jgi:hypothetical protein
MAVRQRGAGRTNPRPSVSLRGAILPVGRDRPIISLTGSRGKPWQPAGSHKHDWAIILKWGSGAYPGNPQARSYTRGDFFFSPQRFVPNFQNQTHQQKSNKGTRPRVLNLLLLAVTPLA